MPVASKYTLCPFGQWTPICEYRASRYALIIQPNSGAVMVSVDTTGPMVQNPAGNFPAGFLLSQFAGNGPGRLSLDKLDGELAWQQWWAYASGADQSDQMFLGAQNEVEGYNGTAITCVINYDFPGTYPTRPVSPVIVVVVYDTIQQAPPPTLISTLAGTLTPIISRSVTAGASYTGHLQVFAYSNPSGADDLEVSSPVQGAIQMEVYAIQGGTVIDRTASAVGTGASMAVSTSAISTIPEWGLAVGINAVALTGAGFDWHAPWTLSSNPGWASTDTDGNAWEAQSALQRLTAVAAVTVSEPTGDPTINWAVGIVTVEYAAAAGNGVVVSVIEAFDLPPPADSDAGRTITARLPQLSAAGVAALKALMSTGTSEVQTSAIPDTADDV